MNQKKKASSTAEQQQKWQHSSTVSTSSSFSSERSLEKIGTLRGLLSFHWLNKTLWNTVPNWLNRLRPFFSFQQLFWLILGGGALIFQYLFTGFLLLFTGIGIPFSFQSWQLAFYSFKPSFHIDAQNSKSIVYRLLNTVWFFTIGWMFSMTNIFFAIALGISSYTRPFAQDHLKMLELNVAPFGKQIKYKMLEPWEQHQVENVQSLIQEDVVNVEKRVEETPSLLSNRLDFLFEHCLSENDKILENARIEIQDRMKKKIDKRMRIVHQSMERTEKNIKTIRGEMEGIICESLVSLKNDLQSVKTELKNVQESHLRALEDVTALQQETDRYRIYEQRYYESQQKLSSERATYETRVAQLVGDFERESNQSKRSNEKSESLQKRIHVLEQERGALRKESEKFKQQVEKNALETEKLHEQLSYQEELQQKYEQLSQQEANLRNELNEAQKKWNTGIQEHKDQLDKVQIELNTTRDALILSQREREHERQRIEKLQHQLLLLQEISEERNRLELQVERDKEEKQLLEKEFQNTISSLHKKHQQEFSHFHNWKEERVRVQQELNDLRQQKVNQDALLNEKNSIEKELSALKENYQRLQGDLVLETRSKEETEDKTRSLVRDVHKLQKRVNQSERSVSTFDANVSREDKQIAASSATIH